VKALTVKRPDASSVISAPNLERFPSYGWASRKECLMLCGKRVSVSLGAALAVAVFAHTDVARAAEPVAATS